MEINDSTLIRLLKIDVELGRAEPEEHIQKILEKTFIENNQVSKRPIEEIVPMDLHRECVYKVSILEEENLLLKKQIEELAEQICYPKFFVRIEEEPYRFKRSIYTKMELPVKDLEICEKHELPISSHDTKEYIGYIIEQHINNISKNYCRRGYRYWVEKRGE